MKRSKNILIVLVLFFCVQVSRSEQIRSWGDPYIDRIYKNLYYNRPWNDEDEMHKILRRDQVKAIGVMKLLLENKHHSYPHEDTYKYVLNSHKYKSMKDTLFAIMVEGRRNADYVAKIFNVYPNYYVDELIEKYPQYASEKKAGSRILYAVSSYNLNKKDRNKVAIFLQKASQYGQHCNREDALEYLYELFPKESKEFFNKNFNNPIYNSNIDTITSADSIGVWERWAYERSSSDNHSLQYWFSKYAIQYNDSALLPQFTDHFSLYTSKDIRAFAYKAVRLWANDSLKEHCLYRGLSDDTPICLSLLDTTKSERIKDRLWYIYKYTAVTPESRYLAAWHLNRYEDVNFDKGVMDLLHNAAPKVDTMDHSFDEATTFFVFPLFYIIGLFAPEESPGEKVERYKDSIYTYSYNKLIHVGFNEELSVNSLRKTLISYAGFSNQDDFYAQYPQTVGEISELFRVIGNLTDTKGFSSELFDDICLLYWYKQEVDKFTHNPPAGMSQFYIEKYRSVFNYQLSECKSVLDSSFFVQWKPAMNYLSLYELGKWHYFYQEFLQWGMKTHRTKIMSFALATLPQIHDDLMGNRKYKSLDDDLLWQDEFAQFVNRHCTNEERLYFLQLSLQFPLHVTVGRLAPSLLGDTLNWKNVLATKFLNNKHIGLTTDVNTLLKILTRYSDGVNRDITRDMLLRIEGRGLYTKPHVSYETYLQFLTKVQELKNVNALLQKYPDLSPGYISATSRVQQLDKVYRLLEQSGLSVNLPIRKEELRLTEETADRYTEYDSYPELKLLTVEGEHCNGLSYMITSSPKLEKIVIKKAPRRWKLPPEFTTLKNLDRMVLENCDYLKSRTFFELPSLKSLSIHNCKHLPLPSISVYFPNIEVLKLSGSSLCSADVKALSSLKKLDSIWIDTTKNSVYELHQLLPAVSIVPNSLPAQRNTLYDEGSREQDSIAIERIRRLYLDDYFQVGSKIDYLEEIDPYRVSVDSNGRVVGLSLHGNRSEYVHNPLELCFAISQLTALKELKLFSCGLEDLPPSLINLKNLETLYLGENNFTKIPQCVFSFKKLKRLIFKSNMLISIPDSIELFRDLEYLDVANNFLTSLPSSLSKLKKLDTLRIGHNKIKKIPKELGECKAIKRIYLAQNGLKSMPRSLDYMWEQEQGFYLDSLFLLKGNKFNIPPHLWKLSTPFRTIVDSFNNIYYPIDSTYFNPIASLQYVWGYPMGFSMEFCYGVNFDWNKKNRKRIPILYRKGIHLLAEPGVNGCRFGGGISLKKNSEYQFRVKPEFVFRAVGAKFWKDKRVDTYGSGIYWGPEVGYVGKVSLRAGFLKEWQGDRYMLSLQAGFQSTIHELIIGNE